KLAADECALHRLEQHAATFVHLGKLSRQAVAHSRHVGARGVERDARLHATDDPQKPRSPRRRRARQGPHRPDTRGPDQLRALRNDADDGEWIAIEPYFATDAGPIAVEAASTAIGPSSVAKYGSMAIHSPSSASFRRARS